jgi:hypothetical protein
MGLVGNNNQSWVPCRHTSLVLGISRKHMSGRLEATLEREAHTDGHRTGWADARTVYYQRKIKALVRDLVNRDDGLV